MTGEWKQELSKLKTLDPPEDLWAVPRARIVDDRTNTAGRGIRIVVAGLVGALALGLTLVALRPLEPARLGANPAASEKGPRSVTSAPDWLQTTAIEIARREGDSSPESGLWMLTTEAAAASAVGSSGGPASQEVALVVLQGNFSVNSKGPLGTSEPTGSFLIFTLDAATHEVLDLTTANSSPDTVGMQPLPLGPALSDATK
jgi:hypothetical protein